MKSIGWVSIVLFFLLGPPGYGQEIVSSIKGKVIEKASFQVIPGASVVLTNTSNGATQGIQTNENGEFEISNINLGRYTLTVSHVGFQTYMIHEINVTAARINNFEIQLDFGVTLLDEVVVDDQIPAVHINMLGKQPITVEQTLRYAATFFDPARLSTSFAGVSTFNDQNNSIIVRGNSPNGVAWRLEGVDIVNPNHLTNAGTFSDRPVQSGGSVNILSSQLLGTSTFLNGAFDASYGNALSGVFDMRYRNGSSDEMKFTAQLSLLGLDFATEGPLTQAKTGSFIVNYRYSTIGLLSAMGVDLGDEAINFQDLSFHVNTSTKKGSTWSVFGLAGNSSNKFMAKKDSSAWEFIKDRQNINFKGGMVGLGISNEQNVSPNSYLKTTLAYSYLENERSAFLLDSVYTSIPLSLDKNKSEMLSLRSEFSTKLSALKSISLGFQLNNQYDQISSELLDENTINTDGEGDSFLFQPFLNFTHIVNQSVSYNLGIRYLYHTRTTSHSLEPRARIKWNFNNYSNIYFRYGLHSMLQTPGVYYYSFQDMNGDYINPNRMVDLTKAHHFIFGYNLVPNDMLRLHLEAYYQDLFNVPVSEGNASSFSVLNQLEGFVIESLENKGTGRNYGLDFTLQKTFANNLYYLANLSLYQSKYTGSDGIERDTRFNGNYAVNFTGGKEFKKKITGSEKTFGLNLSTVYLGGYRDTPIDLASSATTGATVYFEDQAFTIKMKDYFRLNLRLSWTKDKTKYTRTLSLDIQNLTNTKNIAYSYFDTKVQDVVVQNQLGIIPILAYRVEF